MPRPVPPWMNSGLKLTDLRRRQRPRGGRGDFVRLADDESLEPVARIEVRSRGIARSAAGSGASSRISSGVGRGASAAATTAYFADERQHRLPGQRQSVAEMRTHPVGHELAGHHDVERRRCPARKRPGRPASASRRTCVHQGRGEVLSESSPRRPRAVRRPGPSIRSWHESELRPCTGPRLLIIPMCTRQKGPAAPDASRGRQRLLFSLAPRRGFACRKSCFWKPTAGYSSVIFHKSEIISLDSAKLSEIAWNGRKLPIFAIIVRVNDCANRGNCCIFLTVQKRNGPPVMPTARFELRTRRLDLSRARQPVLTGAKISAAAVFLWMTPRATPRAISGWAFFSASAASAFLPDASADSTALMKVRMRLTRRVVDRRPRCVAADALLGLRRVRHRIVL